MFGTLSITLPSDFTGGATVVQHAGRTMKFDQVRKLPAFRPPPLFDLSFDNSCFLLASGRIHPVLLNQQMA